jgi:hypothetical protein
LEPDAFSGALAGSDAGCLPRAEQQQRIGRGRRGDVAEVWTLKRSTSLHFVFLGGWLHGREQDRGSRSTRKHTADTQTHGLRVCVDLACSWCSCSAGSTRVLGVAGLRSHRIAITCLHPARGPLPGGEMGRNCLSLSSSPLSHHFIRYDKRKCLSLSSTHQDIERLQVLGVLLRSGSIRVRLTFLKCLMVVL